MKYSISLVIADDHEIFRDGLALMLSKQEGLTLAGQAENGRQLIELVKELQPDIIITDIKMPLMSGIEATRLLLQQFPGLKIIALSMFDEEHLIVDMLEAGAKGYLLKNADKKEILEAIDAVYGDNNFYCRHTSARLASMIVKRKLDPFKKKNEILFSDREKEIIRLICRQMTAQEIGNQLFLSKRTVEGYRTRIMEKMEAKNTAGVVIFALKNSLIGEEEIR
ncbi:MAG TPA: response regulator transcription factor [Puia sp.]|nr:response regulator transcription factor [Puia sp.]